MVSKIISAPFICIIGKLSRKSLRKHPICCYKYAAEVLRKMWKNKNIAEKVLARLSEWTGVKEEKRRRGPYPLLQLLPRGAPDFAAVVPENHFIQGKAAGSRLRRIRSCR